MLKQIHIHAPGRINLIGEHIDYNGGLVLPAAIDLGLSISLSKANGTSCKVTSIDLEEAFEFDLNNIKQSKMIWHNYILGTVHYILEAVPNSLTAFSCEIKSDLPIGAGLSSSAALECGIASGLNILFDLGLTDNQIAQIGQKAEHHFVGTKCGIMDQFSVLKGKENNFMLLNCETLAFDYVASDLSPWQLLLLNTNVKHSLASSGYNDRFKESREALSIIQNHFPNYQYLAEVSMEDLNSLQAEIPELLYRRAKYIIDEQARVKHATKALQEKDIRYLGELLYESHIGQQREYEISCEELDFLVDFSEKYTEVAGARMMGGGFGGCTINIVHEDFIDQYIERANEAYRQQFHKNLTPIRIKLGDGVKRTKHHD